MARSQIIETATGRKVNVVEWDGASDHTPPDGRRIEPDDGRPFSIAPAPLVVASPAISERQFAQALIDLGVISRAEALAFVERGEVPAALQAALDAISDEAARFVAEMQVSCATAFERAHPSTLALAHARGRSEARMDDLWRRAAAL